MSSRGFMWTLLACLVATVAVLSLAILPSSSSSSGVLGATVHSGNGVACGSVGRAPTKAEVEQFAAKDDLSAADTARLLDCYGFSTSK